VVDRILAVLLLIPVAPVLAVLMAVVKLTSKGPAVYRQARLGYGNRVFWIYKLRTMYVDAERLTGPVWSTEQDPRVTRVGRWLRGLHLDEFPQLWNVLKGDMSLVGPRPERPEIVRQLDRLYPAYHSRLAVLPGITGLAQVQLPPDSDVAEVWRKMACDLCYIERADAWMDFRILVATGLKLLAVSPSRRRQLLALPFPEQLQTEPALAGADGATYPEFQTT
jgi:lipopolysaccharide/colanic/teichoic acid biosynthesis glycosyltransferase